jgi:acetyl-CoA carboxylase biotin carboxyl carrier protein
LEITEAEGKVRIVKSMGVAAPVVMQQVAPVPLVAAPVVAAQVAADTPVVAAVPAGHPVKSPMVGTFYRSSSPGSAPFVQIGSVVKEGDTLCIIEAMKILNEIESDKSGTVTQILCENGQAVEYGQPLFIVE